jgi:ribosomal protein S9
MYGRRGLSSNVGSLSLPITRSSSACARLCTCGKRTSARKREYIDDTVSKVRVSKRGIREYPETQTVSEPAENEVLLQPFI